jgi:hypothetical protein
MSKLGARVTDFGRRLQTPDDLSPETRAGLEAAAMRTAAQLHFGAPLERLAPVGRRLYADEHGLLYEPIRGAVIGSDGNLIADRSAVAGWAVPPSGEPIFLRRREKGAQTVAELERQRARA